jgi:hypothetical protein
MDVAAAGKKTEDYYSGQNNHVQKIFFLNIDLKLKLIYYKQKKCIYYSGA